MNKCWVFVDVDGTLIDKDDKPRPYVSLFLYRLWKCGFTIIVWSAGGHKYAEQKLNSLSRRIKYDVTQFVHIYWWKAWHSQMVVNQPRFYIDDDASLLEARQEEGHGTFKVPFYDDSLMKEKDRWLLDAASAAERFYNEHAH